MVRWITTRLLLIIIGISIPILGARALKALSDDDSGKPPQPRAPYLESNSRSAQTPKV